MKKEPINKLLHHYKNGNTSLEDERFLAENAKNLEFKLGQWVHQTKKKPPKNFNQTLWQTFDKKTKRKSKIIKLTLVAAASFALLITLYVKPKPEQKQTLAEKKALLKEAKELLNNTTFNTNKSIIFETDLVVVYTNN